MRVDPDIVRLVFLLLAGIFYGGVGHMLWRYHHDPPRVTVEQRRRFVFGALLGGTLLVTALVVEVSQHQNKPLRPLTVIGAFGIVVIVLTMWKLLHDAGREDGKR